MTASPTANTTQPCLRVIPLGGLHEIGKNTCVFEYGDDLMLVDAGLAFPSDGMHGVNVVQGEIRGADPGPGTTAQQVGRSHPDPEQRGHQCPSPNPGQRPAPPAGVPEARHRKQEQSIEMGAGRQGHGNEGEQDRAVHGVSFGLVAGR